MKMKLITKSDQLYEDLVGVLYRICHLQDDFEKNVFAKTELEKQVKMIINEQLKTILADCYQLTGCLHNISTAESEHDVRSIIQEYKESEYEDESG